MGEETNISFINMRLNFGTLNTCLVGNLGNWLPLLLFLQFGLVNINPSFRFHCELLI